MTRGHVPIRTCVGCRRRRPKSEMVRLTVLGADNGGQAHPGRGVYICPIASCVEKGLGRSDVRKRLGASCIAETLESLATTTGTENRVDGPHPGRVINDKCH